MKVKLAARALLLTVLLSVSATTVSAQNIAIPNFWDPQERFIKPNVKNLQRLRFLTTTDFPPFSFVNKSKRLSGFHVDLARAICAELELQRVCQIQALPFKDLETALKLGKGEAILAGLAITKPSRDRLSFSRPYFRIPARFVAQKTPGLSEPLITQLAGQDVAVVDGTAHAAYAKSYFGNMKVRLFADQASALAALEKGQVKAFFSDGLSLANWLQQKPGSVCCKYVGDPYLSSKFFGDGLAVALKKDNAELTGAVNYALRAINDKGIFAELYLRYFPISLF